MEQQASDDEEMDTQLARRTRSARTSKSKPSRFVLPSAILPDDSESLMRNLLTDPSHDAQGQADSDEQVLPPQGRTKVTKVVLVSSQEADSDEEPRTWTTRPATHHGMESTRTCADMTSPTARATKWYYDLW